MRLGLAVVGVLTVLIHAQERERLLNPADPAFGQPAPPQALVRLDTTAGEVVIEVIRDWAPRGADCFVNLRRQAGVLDVSDLLERALASTAAE